MADKKPLFLKTRVGEARAPSIERLYGERFRVTRYLDAGQLGKVPEELFAPYGEADVGNVENHPALENLCFVGTGMDASSARETTKQWTTLVFETLTDTLVDEVAPVIDYELNGLRRTTHRLIARPGIDLDIYDFEVGEAVHGDGVGVLAQFKNESTDAVTRLVAVYLEPGVISKAESPGPVPGTTEHTWSTWLLDATNEADMGAGETIPGVVTSKKDDNWEGYKVRLWSSVGGTIAGVKYTYKDIAEVDVPGTVELVTVPVTIVDVSGTIAIPKVTPRRSRTIAATVTVEITTTPPNTASVAYDIGNISCSVTSTQAAYNYRGFDRMSTLSGDLTRTAPRRSANIGANIANFPGCYLVGGAGPVTGTFNYVAGEQMSRSSGGTIVSGEDQTSYEQNTLIGTGSTSADGYVTTGILRRRSRPVFTDLAGVTYYEVITWSVP